MKKEKAINIAKIRQQINKTHSSFISKFGNIALKLSEDHAFDLQRALYKIETILDILINEGVISKFNTESENKYGAIIDLEKTGYAARVFIKTDGYNVIFEEDALTSTLVGIGPLVHRTIIALDDGASWENFAKTLLDFIHVAIYNKTRAYEFAFEQRLKS